MLFVNWERKQRGLEVVTSKGGRLRVEVISFGVIVVVEEPEPESVPAVRGPAL